MADPVGARGLLSVLPHIRIMPNVLGVGIDLTSLLKAMRRTELDLDEQVDEAFRALSKSTQLITELERVLREREEKLVYLKAEHERISALASLTQEQGEAIALSLQQVIGRASKRERVYAFVINLVAGLLIFLLGVGASQLLGS